MSRSECFPIRMKSLLLAAVLGALACQEAFAADVATLKAADQATILVSSDADPLVLRSAELLVQEIKRRCDGAVWTVAKLSSSEAKFPNAKLLIALETPGFHPLSPKIGAATVNLKSPGAEGFILKTASTDGLSAVVIGGSDPHGVLYGVGRFLRKLEIYEDRIVVPSLNLSAKPRFDIRGFRDAGPMPFFKRDKRGRFDYGTFMAEPFQAYMEDVTLWGNNIFMEERNWVKVKGALDITESLGLKIGLYWPSNGISGGKITQEMMPPGRRIGWLVCPSTTAGRKALLAQYEQFAREYPHIDLWTSANSDNGGCGCAKCRPWAKTHIELMRQEAAILRKLHPQLKVAATMVEFGRRPADIKWFQNYIKAGNAKPWLDYLGVASDTHEPFNYEVFIKAGLRPIYADLFTHWDKMPFPVRSGLKIPFDKALWNRSVLLRSVWNRRGGPALMPRRLQGMIRQMAKWNGDGACPYNHGRLHDDTNKYYATQLLWNPDADLKEISEDFARYYFGPKAAPKVAEAMLLMETNWAQAVIDNPDIGKVLALIEEASSQVPQTYQAWNWRFYAFRLRAAMDRMVQIAVLTDPMAFEDAYHKQVLSAEGAEANPKLALEKGLIFLKKWRSEELSPLLAEFDRLLKITRECDKKIKEITVWHPLPDMGRPEQLRCSDWADRYERMASKALNSADAGLMAHALAATFNYQYAGKGGFYDFSGDDRPAKRVHMGELDHTYDRASNPPAFRANANGPWRLSQRLCEMTPHGGAGSSQRLEYEGLDPKVAYRFKLTHWGKPLVGNGTRIMMDAKEIARDLRSDQPRQYVMDVSRELTADGKLRVDIELSPYSYWRGMTEAWLYPYSGGPDVRLPLDEGALEDRAAEIKGGKASAEPPENLLAIGNFERSSGPGQVGLKGWALPSGSIPGWACRGDVSLSEVEANTGRRCLRLNPGTVLIQAQIDAPSDPHGEVTVELSVQVKLPSAGEPCKLEARMEATSVKNQSIPDFPRQIITGPTDGRYHPVTVKWKLPRDTRSILVRILATVPQGSNIYLDDIVLKKTPN